MLPIGHQNGHSQSLQPSATGKNYPSIGIKLSIYSSIEPCFVPFACIQLSHFPGSHINNTFTNVGHPVSHSLEVMCSPHHVVGTVDCFRFSDHLLHQFEIDLVVQLVHGIIFVRDFSGNLFITGNKSIQGTPEHIQTKFCHLLPGMKRSEEHTSEL